MHEQHDLFPEAEPVPKLKPEGKYNTEQAKTFKKVYREWINVPEYIGRELIPILIENAPSKKDMKKILVNLEVYDEYYKPAKDRMETLPDSIDEAF